MLPLNCFRFPHLVARRVLLLHPSHFYRRGIINPSASIARYFTTASDKMAQQYKLKVESADLKNGQKVEAQVEGVEGAKVLLLKVNDQLRALGANCTRM